MAGLRFEENLIASTDDAQIQIPPTKPFLRILDDLDPLEDTQEYEDLSDIPISQKLELGILVHAPSWIEERLGAEDAPYRVRRILRYAGEEIGEAAGAGRLFLNVEKLFQAVKEGLAPSGKKFGKHAMGKFKAASYLYEMTRQSVQKDQDNTVTSGIWGDFKRELGNQILRYLDKYLVSDKLVRNDSGVLFAGTAAIHLVELHGQNQGLSEMHLLALDRIYTYLNTIPFIGDQRNTSLLKKMYALSISTWLHGHPISQELDSISYQQDRPWSPLLQVQLEKLTHWAMDVIGGAEEINSSISYNLLNVVNNLLIIYYHQGGTLTDAPEQDLAKLKAIAYGAQELQRKAQADREIVSLPVQGLIEELNAATNGELGTEFWNSVLGIEV